MPLVGVSTLACILHCAALAGGTYTKPPIPPAEPPLVPVKPMNDMRYIIQNPAAGSEGKEFTFTDEYFEVDSPTFSNRYSEVWWKTLPPVDLPTEIVARFANASIGITGWESNILRHDEATGQAAPVPAFQSYNHHYGIGLKSAFASFVLDKDGQPMGEDRGHGKRVTVEAKDGVALPPGARLYQSFTHGNGQEHRQMYHGAPRGYLADVFAPHQFVVTPMQINTNDGSGQRGGPLPAFSRQYSPPATHYNPLIECPCTDKTVKSLGSVVARNTGSCTKPVLDCFGQGREALQGYTIVSNKTVSDASLPHGCLSTRVGQDSFALTLNLADSAMECQGGRAPATLMGRQDSVVMLALELDEAHDKATIRVTGPSGVWFGVGFNASVMQDLPYAVVVDGAGGVSERQLANHGPGTQLTPSVTVVSNDVTEGLRTVVLSRPLRGLSPDHFSFSMSQATIPFINAVGDTSEFQQHVRRSSEFLRMFRDDAVPTCLCAGAMETINGNVLNSKCVSAPLSDLLDPYNPTCEVSSYLGGLACCTHGTSLLDADQVIPPHVDEVFFRIRFYFQPYLPEKHKLIYHLEWANNGCDSGSSGPVPIPCSHIEYDVLQGIDSPLGKDVQVFQSIYQAGDMLASSCSSTAGQCMDIRNVTTKGVELVMAACHCHAPNCLRQELWNMDTKELLCGAVPILGTSDVLYDESGYLYAPPCLWGTPEEGLSPAPILQLNTTLRMVTIYNSSYSHPGQMGIWQMRGAYL